MTMDPKDLKVWHDDYDWVIAESPTDAEVVWALAMGTTSDHLTDPADRWRALPDDKILKMWCNAKGEIDEPHGDGNTLVARTCAEWVALKGRGYVGGTE